MTGPQMVTPFSDPPAVAIPGEPREFDHDGARYRLEDHGSHWGLYRPDPDSETGWTEIIDQPGPDLLRAYNENCAIAEIELLGDGMIVRVLVQEEVWAQTVWPEGQPHFTERLVANLGDRREDVLDAARAVLGVGRLGWEAPEPGRPYTYGVNLTPEEIEETNARVREEES